MSDGTGIGTRIDGKYLVIEELGRGGMSTVWLARDERLGKLWAIKEIRQGVGGVRGAAFRKAVIDEANLMKRLDHVAIPRVVDILDTGSSVFVVMDYVEGTPLGKAMRERGRPFAQGDVIGWGIQLCDVLSYLHKLEPPVIYRDMKPSNVILREDGTVKLIDFGIALESDSGSHGETEAVGTPGYAAPEQMCMNGARVCVDGRADVYALGVTLYSLVTGHVPKRSQVGADPSPEAFLPRPIRTWDPGLSEGLERVIAKATNADPMLRYESMDQMRYDLEHYERLTNEWREAQRRKIRTFWRWVAASASFAVLGTVLMVGASIVQRSNYLDYLSRAEKASWEEGSEGISAAESLYAQAIVVDRKSLDAYFGLLDVYEHDLILSDAEERRLRTAFGDMGDVSFDSRYAELCFRIGTCYLSYYKIDQAGGSVGNAGLVSIEAAGPWFMRAVECCSEDGMQARQSIDAADLRAAQSYLVVSEFHQRIARGGREGRSVSAEYATFWESICQCIRRERDSQSRERSTEGVCVRLCQVAVESVASTTYLLGFSRAGVTEGQVTELVDGVEACMANMGDFVRLEECGVVYGPVLDEIREGLEAAKSAIQNVYRSPVARLEHGSNEGAKHG